MKDFKILSFLNTLIDTVLFNCAVIQQSSDFKKWMQQITWKHNLNDHIFKKLFPHKIYVRNYNVLQFVKSFFCWRMFILISGNCKIFHFKLRSFNFSYFAIFFFPDIVTRPWRPNPIPLFRCDRMDRWVLCLCLPDKESSVPGSWVRVGQSGWEFSEDNSMQPLTRLHLMETKRWRFRDIVLLMSELRILTT